MPRLKFAAWAFAAMLAIQLLQTASASSAKYLYRFGDAPKRREFNVVAKINVLEKDSAAAVLFCAQDKNNCYRVDFGPASTRIVRMEMGTETQIGSTSGVGIPGPGEHSILIKRRKLTISVALDGVIVAEAFDDTFPRGRIGYASRKDGVDFQAFRSYDCGEVIFGDDFMTTTAVQWKPITGSWLVVEAPDPVYSANPFKYAGKCVASPALATAQPAGSANWDCYSASVSVMDDSGAPVGLVFYYLDQRNYHLFRWLGKQHEKPVREIVRVRNGAETVLATADGGFTPGQWYRLRVDILGTTAKAFVDDNLLLAAKDDHFVGGSIGLYTQSAKGASFDDVSVRGLGTDVFEEDFQWLCPGKWTALGGKWKAGSGSASGSATGRAKLVSGDDRWCNYIVSCDVRLPKTGAAGVAFYFQDEMNHFLYRAEATGKRELIRFFDGAQNVLASAELPPTGKPENTVISISSGLIRLNINGKMVAEAFDPGLSEGRVGLYVEDGSAKFGPLAVNTPPPAEHVLSISDKVFAAEKSQEVFAADQRDWIPTDKFDNNGRKWWWYRANLFGTSSIELDLSEEKADKTSFELALSADSLGYGEGDAASGYTLTVWKAGSWQLAISRQGKKIKQMASVFKDDLWKIEFQRDGRFLFGRLNQKLEIWARDDEPLSGSRAGYALVPPPSKKMTAKVYCPNLTTYTFDRSPVDWRSAAGDWEVSNRWTCDPRWSWFSGEQRGGPAIMWNKHSFKGNFSIEFCGAVKMDSRRGGEYKYARDMNVTIAADGLDLTSGYSMIFGGWQNALSCVTRKNEIAVQPRDRGTKFTNSSNMHRQWWYFKVERIGATIRWYIDNKLAAEYIDPEPLAGTRVALWTYDVGIMVARVRVAADEIGPLENPDSTGNASKATIYDTIQTVTGRQ